MNWDYFDRFEIINRRYLPSIGQGDNMATQIVTAVNKLIYNWYNDGDVYDNHYFLQGWCNDISDCANWLSEHAYVGAILDRISVIDSEEEYELILKDLADTLLCDETLDKFKDRQLTGSIYDCKGNFEFDEDLLVEDDEEER